MKKKYKSLAKIRTMSFKWKVIILLEFFAILANIFIALVVWNVLHETIRNTSQDKLIAVASSAAVAIDLAKHEAILEESDMEGADYRSLQTLLRKIQQSDEQIDDIYTLRKSEKENIWQFVVAANETQDADGNGAIDDSEIGVMVGEEFDVSELPQMKQAFDGPIADEDINCDKWGCWLSGYAPILDENGEAVAIVGVDISAAHILAFESDVRWVAIAIIATLLVLIPLVFYFLLSALMKPMKNIVTGIHGFQQNMATRLDVNTGDEFEMIAVTFNTMAEELEGLYQGMEKSVSEKTKELAAKVEDIEKRNANDEALLASIGDGLVAVDSEGKIIMLNRHALEILGVTDIDSVLHQSFCENMKLEDDKGETIPCAKHPAHKALSKGIRKSFSYTLIRTDGKRIPLFMTVAPIVMSGKTIGAISVFHDITREKEIDKAKSEFVSLASHQLRTPLSAIKWYAEMLFMEKTGRINDKQQKYLNEIYQSNQTMIDLVNSLLNVSRIEMGTFSVEPELVDVRAVIDSVATEMGPAVEKKKLALTVSYAEKIPQMQADPTLLRIIFQNLISNAVRYTNQNGKINIEAKILLRRGAKIEKGMLQVSVRDTGIGIPKNQQKHLFTKLFRADNARESVTDGNGLGLYMIKSILETSGGKISFSSEEGKGSEFIVLLPLAGMRSRSGQKRLNFCARIDSCELDAGNVVKK